MKSAEELIKIAIRLRECAETLPQTVEKLQEMRLDAMKEGMRRAAREVKNPNINFPACIVEGDKIRNAILTAADNLTLEDLK